MNKMNFQQFADFYHSFNEEMKINVLSSLIKDPEQMRWMEELKKMPCTKQGEISRADMITIEEKVT